MKRDDEVDVFRVAERHGAVHEALADWATWARGKPSPMYARSLLWKLARAGYRQDQPAQTRRLIDEAAAVRVEKLVATLPARHRDTLRWWYVWQWPSVNEYMRMQGLTRVALLRVCDDARDMLANLLKAGV